MQAPKLLQRGSAQTSPHHDPSSPYVLRRCSPNTYQSWGGSFPSVNLPTCKNTRKIHVVPQHSSSLRCPAAIPTPGFHPEHPSLLPCSSVPISPGLVLSIPHSPDFPSPTCCGGSHPAAAPSWRAVARHFIFYTIISSLRRN